MSARWSMAHRANWCASSSDDQFHCVLVGIGAFTKWAETAHQHCARCCNHVWGLSLAECYLGTPESSEKHAVDLVKHWMTEIWHLAEMARAQPQVSYKVFTMCLTGRWTYHLCCLAINPSCLRMIDDSIRTDVLPALTGHGVPADSPLQLICRDCSNSRLGLVVFVFPSCPPLPHRHEASLQVTRPLVKFTILSQVPPTMSSSR